MAGSPTPAQMAGGSSSEPEGLYATPDLSNLQKWRPAPGERPTEAYLRKLSEDEKSIAKQRREKETSALGLSARHGTDAVQSKSGATGRWPVGLAGSAGLFGLAALAVGSGVIFYTRHRRAARRAQSPAALILGLANAPPSGKQLSRGTSDRSTTRRAA